MMSPLTPGALAKIGRSRRHTHDLLGAIAQWTTSLNVQQDVEIAADRLSWILRLDCEPGPPLREWALIAGDAIHNARAALDVAVYELGNGDTLTSPQQKAVAFPIVTDADEWPKAAKRLSMLPADLLERIRMVQPFQRPEAERTKDVLPDLHTLDIADKHRLPLTAVARPASLEHAFMIEFEDNAKTEGPPDVTFYEPELAPRAVLLEGRSVDRIEQVNGRVDLSFTVCIDVPGRGPTGAQEILDSAALYARQVIAFLADPGITASRASSPEALTTVACAPRGCDRTLRLTRLGS
jgi:hypothetical protein